MSKLIPTFSRIYLLLPILLLAAGCGAASVAPEGQTEVGIADGDEETRMVSHTTTVDGVALPRTEAEWKEKLTPEQYYVLRQKGTEYAFTGELWDSKTPGIYVCAGCGQPLFASDTKYESGTGWPSFYQPIDEKNVVTHADDSLFTRRTEVVCSRCDGHLGHVFPDGPLPTGLRYCLNSAALELEPAE